MLGMSQATPGHARRTGMEALITVLALAAPWFLLDLFASRLGVDSRDTLPDDHRR